MSVFEDATWTCTVGVGALFILDCLELLNFLSVQGSGVLETPGGLVVLLFLGAGVTDLDFVGGFEPGLTWKYIVPDLHESTVFS